MPFVKPNKSNKDKVGPTKSKSLLRLGDIIIPTEHKSPESKPKTPRHGHYDKQGVRGAAKPP